MKYKIKIETFVNGRQEFTPFVLTKTLGIFPNWKCVWSDGSTSSMVLYHNTRPYALDCIDKHYEGNCKSIDIQFEYINK